MLITRGHFHTVYNRKGGILLPGLLHLSVLLLVCPVSFNLVCYKVVVTSILNLVHNHHQSRHRDRWADLYISPIQNQKVFPYNYFQSVPHSQLSTYFSQLSFLAHCSVLSCSLSQKNRYWFFCVLLISKYCIIKKVFKKLMW